MRILLLILLACCGYYYSSGQEGVTFHLHMNPGLNYHETIRMNSFFAVNYDSSSQEMQDAMKNSGQPTSVTQETMMKSEIHTGKRGPDAVMPVRMVILTDSGGGLESALPPGSTYYGSVSGDKLPTYDSIVTTGTIDKKVLLQLINKMMGQMNIPDTILSAGRPYVQSVPLSIPVSGMNMKIGMRFTYLLTGYTADTAGVDYKVEGTVDTKGSVDAGGGIGVAGAGKVEGYGHIVYDRKENYPLDYRLNMVMNIGVKAGEMNMHLSSRMKFTGTFVITPE